MTDSIGPLKVSTAESGPIDGDRVGEELRHGLRAGDEAGERDQDDQRREQRQDRVVRERGGPVVELVLLELGQRALERRDPAVLRKIGGGCGCLRHGIGVTGGPGKRNRCGSRDDSHPARRMPSTPEGGWTRKKSRIHSVSPAMESRVPARMFREGSPHMTRRTAVAALATVAAFGVAAAPAAAAKKNEIRIVGGTKFKAGKYVKDDVRFKPRPVSVKSGATVKVVNKGLGARAAHDLLRREEVRCPRASSSRAARSSRRSSPRMRPIRRPRTSASSRSTTASASRTTRPACSRSTRSATRRPRATRSSSRPAQGTSFKVTAKKGSTLPYYCAIHPWMQGKIKVK